ncbi:MAG: hypothetical protein J6386_18915 [Candidatus Synoicihabitans palmerolidicus]|nr:hypothetical protein [Candidatus Synoicihabitans palmerolidicus]
MIAGKGMVGDSVGKECIDTYGVYAAGTHIAQRRVLSDKLLQDKLLFGDKTSMQGWTIGEGGGKVSMTSTPVPRAKL